MHKVIAITGLAGSGKTEAADFFTKKGLTKIRFGEITYEIARKRKIRYSEVTDKKIREEIRRRYGMSAYARLNLAKIKKALKKNDVLIDGLYSFEEYLYLKKRLKSIFLLAIYASPRTRYQRLAKRKKDRPLKKATARARDMAELKNLNKGTTIALADYTVVNESSKRDLRFALNKIFKEIYDKNKRKKGEKN